MISNETIELVKAKASVIDVIGEVVKLKKKGANHTGLCPFHNEKTPSFTVSQAKEIYKCFGCGRSGDVIQFVIEHEKLSYVQAIEFLAKKYNIEIEESGPRKAFEKPTPRLEKLDKKKLDYFENKRMISNNTLLRMNITEAVEWMPQFEKEVPVICFNYMMNGELVNIKYKGPKLIENGKEKKTFKLHKNAKLIFYNIDSLKDEDTGIIVEGEIDTLTLVECGIYNVVGVPNGTPPRNSKMNLEYLDNCWEVFSKLKTVIIAVDNDNVGGWLKEELGRRIGKDKCKIISYPDGCKDSNDVLVKYGKQAVRDMISAARDWPVEGPVPPEDLWEVVQDYYENGYPPGDKSGVAGLDDLLTFMPGLLTTFTGIPGHGKDEMCNEIMVGLAKNCEWTWAVFSFEEPPEIHVTKLMEKLTRKAFTFRKNPEDRMTRMQFDKAFLFLEKHFYHVKVSEIDVTMDGIINKAIELVKRFGIKGIIINPWNYLEHKRSPGQNETEYISEALTKLCNFLWKYGVHGFLVAHPTKINKDKQTKKYEVPTLYSISGSAHFFNKTYNGICIYRNYDTNITELYVQKVKWYWHGEIGWSSYQYNVNTRQYQFLDTSYRDQQEDEVLQIGKTRYVPVNSEIDFGEQEDDKN